MKRSTILVTMLCCVLLLPGCIKHKETTYSLQDEDYVTGEIIDELSQDIIPSLSELPEAQLHQFVHTRSSMLFFEAHSLLLNMAYTEETYATQKAQLEDTYAFLNEPVAWDNDGNSVLPETSFSLGSYHFRVVAPTEGDHTDYPHSFGIVGTSDEKHSVAYLYFYDADLDYIGQKGDESPMADFVQRYTEYDF